MAEGCLTAMARGPVSTEDFLQMLSLAYKASSRVADFSKLSLTRAHDFL